MSNPNVPLGNLNRLKASVVWNNFPALNVTASFLSREGISLAPEGVQTLLLPAMTGVVMSPEPYQLVRVTMNLLKSQGLADLYKLQAELNTLLGPCTVRPDVTEGAGIGPWSFDNCAIETFGELRLSGQQEMYPIVFGATYYLNANLWN